MFRSSLMKPGQWANVWIIGSAVSMAAGMTVSDPIGTKMMICSVIAALWAIEAHLKGKQ